MLDGQFLFRDLSALSDAEMSHQRISLSLLFFINTDTINPTVSTASPSGKQDSGPALKDSKV